MLQYFFLCCCELIFHEEAFLFIPRTVFSQGGGSTKTHQTKLPLNQKKCFFTSEYIEKRSGFSPSVNESPLKFKASFKSLDLNSNFDGKLGVADLRRPMSLSSEIPFQNRK